MSLRVLSKASIAYLDIIGVSSHRIISASLISSASFDSKVMLQVDVGSKFIGILRREWAVRPPGNRRAAIPEEANASAILLLDLTYARMHEYKKVLPVPPGPSIKKICS
jgi:hypothetical protein